MDKRILLFLILIIVIIASILGYMMIFGQKCELPEITYQPQSPKVGDVITFGSNNNAGKKITWTFGDGQTATDEQPTHKYDSAGAYKVNAKIEDKCDSTINVMVLEGRKHQTVTPTVIKPSEIHANEATTFSDATKDATQWAWSVKETKESFSTQSCNITFKRTGNYTITLKVNGQWVDGETTFNVRVTKAVPIVDNEKAFNDQKKREEMEQRKKEAEERNRDKAAADKLKKEEQVQKQKEADHQKRADADAAKARKDADERQKRDAEEKKKQADLDAQKNEQFHLDQLKKEFKADFVKIANELPIEGNNSGDDWRDKIVPKCCVANTMKVQVVDESMQVLDNLSLERFRTQMVASNKYDVQSISNIVPGGKSCFTEITVVVKVK